MRRTWDIIFSLLLLLFSMPLFLIIGIMVHLDSKGPVFFYSDENR